MVVVGVENINNALIAVNWLYCEDCGHKLIHKKITKNNVFDIMSRIDYENFPVMKLPEKIRMKALEGVLLKAYNYYECSKCDYFYLKKTY